MFHLITKDMGREKSHDQTMQMSRFSRFLCVALFSSVIFLDSVAGEINITRCNAMVEAVCKSRTRKSNLHFDIFDYSFKMYLKCWKLHMKFCVNRDFQRSVGGCTEREVTRNVKVCHRNFH